MKDGEVVYTFQPLVSGATFFGPCQMCNGTKKGPFGRLEERKVSSHQGRQHLAIIRQEFGHLSCIKKTYPCAVALETFERKGALVLV